MHPQCHPSKDLVRTYVPKFELREYHRQRSVEATSALAVNLVVGLLIPGIPLMAAVLGGTTAAALEFVLL